MSLRKLLAQLARGEDDRCLHLEDVSTGASLAAEMAAFANSDGGTIYVGVAPDGAVPGLPRAELGRVYQVIRFAALQQVCSSLEVAVRHVRLAEGSVVVVIRVPRGHDRPHFDRQGVIWCKHGADKRRVTSKAALFALLPGVYPFAEPGGENKPKTRMKTGMKTGLNVMALLKKYPTATIDTLAAQLGLSRAGVGWQLDKLKAQGRLRRLGPARGGHWEVLD